MGRPNLVFRLTVVAMLVMIVGSALMGSGVAPSAYNLIQNNAVSVTRRSTLNFVNGGCADNGGTQSTDCTFLTTVPANFVCSFTTQTSVTCTHNLNTTAPIVAVYDAASPPNLILPTTEQITSANVVTVTFSVAQSGKVVVSGASGSGTSGVSSVQTATGAVTLFNNNAQTANYQVLASDFIACKTITVASGTFTITLVASGAQPPDGQCVRVINYGSGVVTVARSGQNINGAAANLTLAAGSASAPTGVWITSDSSNYFAQPLGASSGGGGSAFFSGSLTAIVPGDWSAIGTGGTVSTVTGAGGGNALKVTGLAGTGTDGNWAGRQVAVAGATWTKTIIIYGPTIYSTSGTATNVMIGFTDGTKVEGIVTGYLTNGVPATGAASLTNVTGGTIGTVSSSQVFVAGTGPVFIQLVKSNAGNTLTGSISADGINYDQVFTESGPFLAASGVAVISSARGGAFGPVFYLESFQ